jgi:hypothetical protein
MSDTLTVLNHHTMLITQQNLMLSNHQIKRVWSKFLTAYICKTSAVPGLTINTTCIKISKNYNHYNMHKNIKELDLLIPSPAMDFLKFNNF